METIAPEQYDTLTDPSADGVLRVASFLTEEALHAAQAELQDPDRIAWRDNHSKYVNGRGLTIVQNHDVYALRLGGDDQEPLDRIPSIMRAAQQVQRFVRGLSSISPALSHWQPNELSLHRYDNAEVGLSFHKDNLRFIGVVAIVCFDGECDLAIRRAEVETPYSTEPGDLVLLRAPGLVENESGDLRPEHAVINLRTPTRTSMMLRHNIQPDELLPGFSFDN